MNSFITALIRNKELEIDDLKAKIAQLLAIMPLLPSMPTSEYHQTNPATSSNSSMMRLGGDGSPSCLLNNNDMNNNNNKGGNNGNQMTNGGGGDRSSSLREAKLMHIQQQQQQQQVFQQPQIHVSVSSSNAASTLDPNALAYTPKSPGSSSSSAEMA